VQWAWLLQAMGVAKGRWLLKGEGHRAVGMATASKHVMSVMH
jgi:hypothetical protein